VETELRSMEGSGRVADDHASTPLDAEPRCWRCNKKLAEIVSRPWVIVCVRCKARNQA
jgi:hypothetical protein